VRTFTIFYRGTVDFRHMGVQVSRMCTNFCGVECFDNLLLGLAKKHNTQHSGSALTATPHACSPFGRYDIKQSGYSCKVEQAA
jgi:hypothetical protein